MGKKRGFSEANADAYNADMADRKSRDRQPGRGPGDKHKAKKHKTDEDNFQWVKKRSRDIERLLQRKEQKGESLPANTRVELERELEAHRQRVSEHQADKKRSKMIQKYHGVRFFERQKASRLVKQLRKQLEKATDADEIARIKQELHISEVDLDYTMYFPLMERYVSIYSVVKGQGSQAKKDGDEQEESLTKTEKPGKDGKSVPVAAAALHAPRPPLWALVEETRKEGSGALQQLRDRRPDVDAQEERQKAPASKSTKSKGKSAAHGKPREAPKKSHPLDDGDDESDGGGFFEED